MIVAMPSLLFVFIKQLYNLVISIKEQKVNNSVKVLMLNHIGSGEGLILS